MNTAIFIHDDRIVNAKACQIDSDKMLLFYWSSAGKCTKRRFS